MEIGTYNVNTAYCDGLHWLRVAGVKESSRNGAVIVSPEPILLTYHRPRERVLFSPLRDCNPTFFFMEALWMLAGREDVAFLQYFNSKYNFTDDGKIVPGAYGYRWREKYGLDQLQYVIRELKHNPESRRATLVMSDAKDLMRIRQGTVDTPCNTGVYFDRRDGKLNMTVLCRSNDAIWGTFGANAVHFSMLQEYIAAGVGVKMGVYRQFSNNFHLYPANFPHDLFEAAEEAKRHDYYSVMYNVEPMPMVQNFRQWEIELFTFMEDPLAAPQEYSEPFFREVAVPMYRAWYVRKTKQGTGLEEAQQIAAPDWRIACTAWIERREAKKHV
jgi:thymidylate synthase